MVDFSGARRFLLAAYHDLPNILFIGSLILGGIMGYLPLIWMALGLIFNAAVVSLLQAVLNVASIGYARRMELFGSVDNLTAACTIGFQRMSAGPNEPLFANVGTQAERVITPSYWISSAAFFAVFSIYNSARILFRAPAKGADNEKVGARRAFSLSAFVIGIAFLGLVLLRGFTGCETLWSGLSGLVVGASLSIAFWHILDACGTGKVPDLLQVVGSMAPDATTTDKDVPIVCTPPEDS